MLKVLQARLKQYVNEELLDVQTGFRKGRWTRDHITNIPWIIQKARKLQKKKIYFCFIDYTKPLTVWIQKKIWTILKEIEISDHLTSLLRNLYIIKEAIIRTRHGTMDWFQVGKGCILSLCLFILYAEYIMRNARLDEAQLESRLLGEISITSYMQMPPLYGRKWRGTKEPLESERGEWKK